MSSYSVISEVTTELMNRLKNGLVPDLIPDEHGLEMCSPAEHGDASLGIWLYDVRECEDIRVSGMLNNGIYAQKYPPMFLTLFVMITPYSASDLQFRAVQEQRIMGRVLQILNDNSYITADSISGGDDSFDIKIELMNLDVQKQREIWNMNNIPYKTSLYYKITPLEISSEKVRSVTPVGELKLEMEERKTRHGRHL